MTIDNLMGLIIGAIIGEYFVNYVLQGWDYKPKLANVFWFTVGGYIFNTVFFS